MKLHWNMKILLDENIDVRFKKLFDSRVHAVFTIKEMGWQGIKNGELLQLLQKNLFDIFITVDKDIPYQQNRKALPVLIIILNVKRNVLERITKIYLHILELIAKPIQNEIKILNE